MRSQSSGQIETITYFELLLSDLLPFRKLVDDSDSDKGLDAISWSSLVSRGTLPVMIGFERICKKAA